MNHEVVNSSQSIRALGGETGIEPIPKTCRLSISVGIIIYSWAKAREVRKSEKFRGIHCISKCCLSLWYHSLERAALLWLLSGPGKMLTWRGPKCQWWNRDRVVESVFSVLLQQPGAIPACKASQEREKKKAAWQTVHKSMHLSERHTQLWQLRQGTHTHSYSYMWQDLTNTHTHTKRENDLGKCMSVERKLNRSMPLSRGKILINTKSTKPYLPSLENSFFFFFFLIILTHSNPSISHRVSRKILDSRIKIDLDDINICVRVVC